MLASATTIISSLMGLLYTNGGHERTVKNIYDQTITLYGDGIYAENSLIKVGATKGTDIVMVLVSILLIMTYTVLKERTFSKILRSGLLCCLFYASTCLIMGVSFNRLFILYLVIFSSTLYAFILNTMDILHTDSFDSSVYSIKTKGMSLFMIIGGCSVLIWLMFIIPAIISGKPTDFIEIYTTEPTFAIDLGIILPACVACGIGLNKHKHSAFAFASILMTLLTCVGLCVIFQTIVQLSLGIELEPGQIIGLVISFIVLGIFATYFNIKLLRKCSTN